ncbi:MAG: hypothetical protein SWH61_05065 [Thermodesulfobacteriota bacterium]|nr:hypothetical protein [Thermodesulfobacteriota bacterium]
MNRKNENNHRDAIMRIENEIIPIEGNLVELRCDQGIHVCKLKSQKREEYKNFKAYAKERLPGIHYRTLQRCAQIAMYANTEDCPALRHLGFTCLLDLMRNEDDKHVETILKRANIDIPEDEENIVGMKQFRFMVNQYLAKKKKKSKTPKNKKPAEKTSPGKKSSAKLSIKQKAAKLGDDALVKKYSHDVKGLSAWTKAIKDRELYDDIELDDLQELIKRLKFILKKCKSNSE